MTATFWDKRSKRYDENVRKHDSVYRKTMDSAKSLLTGSDVVLDFGCASGEMSLDLAPHVQRVHGIDVSSEMIVLAKQKARARQVDNVSFEQLDVFDERLERNSFSAILALNVFHLLDDPPKGLARLTELLAAGGLLISQTPCLGERSWLFRFMVTLAQKAGYAPKIWSFTIPELGTLVSGSRLEILETELWDEKDGIQRIVARKP